MYTINNSDESALLLCGLNISAVFKEVTPVKERTLGSLGIKTIQDCLDQDELFLDYVDNEELLEDIRSKNYLYTEIKSDVDTLDTVVFNVSINDIDPNTEIKVLNGRNDYMVNLCSVSKDSANKFTVTLIPKSSLGILIIGAGEIIIEENKPAPSTLSVQASQDNKMIQLNIQQTDVKVSRPGLFKSLFNILQSKE